MPFEIGSGAQSVGLPRGRGLLSSTGDPGHRRRQQRRQGTQPRAGGTAYSVSDLVRELQPVNPVYCIRPESIKLACNFFVNNFPGKPLYAVKTKPHKNVIKHIYQNGITNFDVASLEEIKLVKSIAKDAKLYFMHTVKNR